MAVVFVYGTLTDPDRLSAVLERYTLGPPAVCEGLQRVDGTYPTLAPGESVDGRLLATSELAQLDAYEGLDRGLYCRVSVPLSRTPDSDAVDSAFQVDTAEVYVGNPSLLDVSDRIEWPASGPFEHRVRSYVESESVHIRSDIIENSD